MNPSTFPIFAHLNFFLSILSFFFSSQFLSLHLKFLLSISIYFSLNPSWYSLQCKVQRLLWCGPPQFNISSLHYMRTCCSCKYFVLRILWTTLSIRPLNDNKPDVNVISLLYYVCIVLWTSVLWFELLWQDILSTLHCFMDPQIPWLRATSSFSHPLELDCSFLLSADFYLFVGQGAIEHFCCKDEPSSFPQKNKAIPSCCRRIFCLSRPWSKWSIWHHKSEYTIH